MLPNRPIYRVAAQLKLSIITRWKVCVLVGCSNIRSGAGLSSAKTLLTQLHNRVNSEVFLLGSGLLQFCTPLVFRLLHPGNATTFYTNHLLMSCATKTPYHRANPHPITPPHYSPWSSLKPSLALPYFQAHLTTTTHNHKHHKQKTSQTSTCLYRSCAALENFSGHLDKSQVAMVGKTPNFGNNMSDVPWSFECMCTTEVQNNNCKMWELEKQVQKYRWDAHFCFVLSLSHCQ